MVNRKFLYDEEFDFDSYVGMPNKVVCFHFIPRSGSNLLADLVRQVGRMGFPLEYFSPANLEYLGRRLPGLEKYSFSRLVNCRTSPNGVFSYKWNSNFGGLECAEAVASQFEGGVHIFIDRRDREAQAKSYWDALKSQEWINRKGCVPMIKSVCAVDEDIRWAVHELEKIRAQTLAYLRRQKADYLTIYAEEIFCCPQKVISEIAEFCEIELSGVDLPSQSRWTAPS